MEKVVHKPFFHDSQVLDPCLTAGEGESILSLLQDGLFCGML